MEALASSAFVPETHPVLHNPTSIRTQNKRSGFLKISQSSHFVGLRVQALSGEASGSGDSEEGRPLNNGFGLVSEEILSLSQGNLNQSDSSEKNVSEGLNLDMSLSPPSANGAAGGTRAGLFRTPISGGVQSATSAHGLPRPALAVRNLMEQVHSHVDIYNFSDNTWGGRFDMPKEMAHSHLGMVTDGRYIYIVTGQYGPQCRGPTAHTFVLDTETKQWRDMPPLPVPRYAPATQLWRGRLHVMGGSKENRYTPGVDHWSLAVKDGKVLEKEWRTEMPIPRGGPHRACIVVDDRLYLIGGQEGDFMAKPGSPIFKCSRRNEVVYGDVYMLDDEMKWKVLPPMPKPDSHIEFAWVVVNNSIVIVGGTTEKHPVTKKMTLVGEIFQFNLNTLNWSVLGKLPFRVKTTLVGFWNGWLYFTSGQRDKGPENPAPKKVIGELWRTKLKLSS